MSRIVITGDPGAVKTTLSLALRDRGLSLAGESARATIHCRMIEVPRVTVAERCAHVLRALADSAS